MGRVSLNPFRRRTPADEERQISTIEQFIQAFSYAGNTYAYSALDAGVTQTHSKNVVARPTMDFAGNVQVFRTNSVVAACLDLRQAVFSATRFQWQQLNNGRASEMFGDTNLSILEHPWPGGTTQDLLSAMLQDADLAGNSYWVLSGRELVRLRPDWVDVSLTERVINGAVVGYDTFGYVYTEGGSQSGSEPAFFYPYEVAHFMPRPDPAAPWRGQSWLTALIRTEVYGDELMSEHKRRFFENAATPNMIVEVPREISPEAFEKYAARMDAAHKGASNAHKTMYLGGGSSAKVVGNDFTQIAFTAVQAAGETRIAAAAGVPPVLVGLSEGLGAATYSNYSQARRRFADGTIHPLWQNAVGSLEHLIKPKQGRTASSAVRLWYDSRDVPFLREDQEQAAEIAYKRSLTVRQYVDAGYTPKSAVAAVEADDPTLLEHTGLFSVMLMPPGTTAPDSPTPAPDTAGTDTGGTA